jgi:hypothetical protein
VVSNWISGNSKSYQTKETLVKIAEFLGGELECLLVPVEPASVEETMLSAEIIQKIDSMARELADVKARLHAVEEKLRQ